MEAASREVCMTTRGSGRPTAPMRSRALVTGAVFTLVLIVPPATALLVLPAAFRSAGGRPAASQGGAAGGPFRLQASTGGVVSTDALKGKPFLLFFGYTHCPDVCPTTLAEVSDLIEDVRKG